MTTSPEVPEGYSDGLQLYPHLTSPAEFAGGPASIGGSANPDLDGIVALNAAAQHAKDTGKVLVIPAPYYSIGSTFQVPTGVRIIFQGVLKGLAVVGALMQIGVGGGAGESGVGTHLRTRLEGVMLGGRADEGLLVSNAQLVDVSGCMAAPGASFKRFARFRYVWGSNFQNFFSWADIADYSAAAADRNVKEDCFVFGRAVNANQFTNFYTSNATTGTNFLFDCDWGEPSPAGSQISLANVFSNFCAQGACQGLWFRRWAGAVVLGFYSEHVARPIVFGNRADTTFQQKAISCNVFGGFIVDGTLEGNLNRAKAIVAVDFEHASSCKVTGVQFDCCYSALDWATVTVTGGGVNAQGAEAVAVVNKAGNVIGAYWTQFGTGYTSPPTLTVTASTPNGGVAVSGSGAVLTATAIPGPQNMYGGATGITITNPGSGYGVNQPYFKAVSRYYIAYDCEVSGMFAAKTLHSWGGSQIPTWPLYVRAPDAYPQCGVNGTIYHRFGAYPSDGGTGFLQKVVGEGQLHSHVIRYVGTAGGVAERLIPFVPAEMALT
ncbi:MAG: hypothetical protein ACRDBG_28225 [Waterburya sp.]